MNLNGLFSRRYLLGKKSTSAINIIAIIAVLGLALGTAALIVILSIFNGFGDLIGNLFNAYNPDIKIQPTTGKTFQLPPEKLEEIASLEQVMAYSKTLEEMGLFEYRSVQDVGTVKGVDTAFARVTNIDSTIREGFFDGDNIGPPNAVIGAGLARRMSISVNDFFTAFKIYVPQKQKGPLDKAFKMRAIQPSGIFSFQQEYDHQYILTPLSFLQGLLDTDEYGAIEIRLSNLDDLDNVKEELHGILGDDYIILDRFEQDSEFLKLMRMEKWMGFAITSLTLVIIAFTLIGTLWMIILDKKHDILILKSMGSLPGQIRRIFFSTGMLLTLTGLISGVILGIGFCLLQIQFGIIGIPEGFIVSAYPIRLISSDVIIVALTVLIIGSIASIVPAYSAAKVDGSVMHGG